MGIDPSFFRSRVCRNSKIDGNAFVFIIMTVIIWFTEKKTTKKAKQ